MNDTAPSRAASRLRTPSWVQKLVPGQRAQATGFASKPGEGRNALIVGPYRAKNFGDDLVGAILTRHLQGLGYEVSIPRLGEENCKWLGTTYAADYSGAFEQADVIVVGGGGIMSDTSGAKPGASYLEIVDKAARAGDLKNKNIYITSVGAGPWLRERSRELALSASNLASHVGVRELESFEHLRGLGVPDDKIVLGADLALLTPEILSYRPARSRKLGLQFDVNAFDDVKENPHLKEIVATVGQYASDHSSGVVLIRNGKARSEISHAAPSAACLSYTDLQTFLPQLAGLRALLTSHLHLAITSYSQRIPTYSLYVREKTRRFYEQIGHPERALDLRTATVDDAARFLNAAAAARWTEEDEEKLLSLKQDARKLLAFVR
ncbi:polysaccharide pyruvyl transferase family protein [Microbacterium sp. A82]|uniref:polysaccharide pyruvyl transferase family protein n=1 Tax=Microbacterium sp. A82 TaxID=3450452 RepID=UPI003F314EDF